MDTIIYTCEQCHHLVTFYPGFIMVCRTTRTRPSHVFQPKDINHE